MAASRVFGSRGPRGTGDEGRKRFSRFPSRLADIRDQRSFDRRRAFRRVPSGNTDSPRAVDAPVGFKRGSPIGPKGSVGEKRCTESGVSVRRTRVSFTRGTRWRARSRQGRPSPPRKGLSLLAKTTRRQKQMPLFRGCRAKNSHPRLGKLWKRTAAAVNRMFRATRSSVSGSPEAERRWRDEASGNRVTVVCIHFMKARFRGFHRQKFTNQRHDDPKGAPR